MVMELEVCQHVSVHHVLEGFEVRVAGGLEDVLLLWFQEELLFDFVSFVLGLWLLICLQTLVEIHQVFLPRLHRTYYLLKHTTATVLCI